MNQAELLIGGLFVAIAGLGALALRLSIPYPIVLVIAGAIFGFIPAVSEVKLDPDVVLVVFLPVLVYGAAFFANLADLRRFLRSITLSSVGLAITAAVAGSFSLGHASVRLVADASRAGEVIDA